MAVQPCMEWIPIKKNRITIVYIRTASRLVILIDCMIFLSPFLDVIRMSMSAVSFFVYTAKLNSGILCPHNVFFWHRYDLNGFKSRIKRHPLNEGSF